VSKLSRTTTAPVVRLSERPARLVRLDIVRDIQPVIDGGASTAAPGHVEALPRDVLHSPLLLMATPLAIHANVVLNSPAPYC
jgi:hypothetical protein